jgi:hypothetical protein
VGSGLLKGRAARTQVWTVSDETSTPLVRRPRVRRLVPALSLGVNGRHATPNARSRCRMRPHYAWPLTRYSGDRNVRRGGVRDNVPSPYRGADGVASSCSRSSAVLSRSRIAGSAREGCDRDVLAQLQTPACLRYGVISTLVGAAQRRYGARRPPRSMATKDLPSNPAVARVTWCPDPRCELSRSWRWRAESRRARRRPRQRGRRGP